MKGGPNYDTALHNMRDTLTLTRTDLRMSWLEITEMCARRRFTFPQDILPAISGAARLVSEYLYDDYLAGIWKTDLARGVLWNYSVFVEPLSPNLTCLLEELQHPKCYVAPSWSWAGHGDIFMFRNHKNHVSTVECEATGMTTIDGENMFGRVIDGHILVTGRTCQIGPYTAMFKQDGFTAREIALTENVKVHCAFDFRTKGKTLRGNFKLILVESSSNELARISEKEMNEAPIIYINGLVVHRKGQSDDFFRVGKFVSWSESSDTLAFFRRATLETIRIV